MDNALRLRDLNLNLAFLANDAGVIVEKAFCAELNFYVPTWAQLSSPLEVNFTGVQLVLRQRAPDVVRIPQAAQPTPSEEEEADSDTDNDLFITSLAAVNLTVAGVTLTFSDSAAPYVLSCERAVARSCERPPDDLVSTPAEAAQWLRKSLILEGVRLVTQDCDGLASEQILCLSRCSLEALLPLIPPASGVRLQLDTTPVVVNLEPAHLTALRSLFNGSEDAEVTVSAEEPPLSNRVAAVIANLLTRVDELTAANDSLVETNLALSRAVDRQTAAMTLLVAENASNLK